MVEKKGLKSPPLKQMLTETEKEILHLITEEFLTVKQISLRRNCSLQAVYKIIKKLKKKGAMHGGLRKVEKVEPTHHKSDLRLHGQEFNIKIIWQDERYQKMLKKSDILFIDSNTVRLYKNSIEIYSGQSFFGKNTEDVEKRSLEYWQRFLARLEHDLKIVLIKGRARNIKIVNQHWARGDSELSDNAHENKKRVWVYAEEDGKLCFITDDSFGFKEDETVHPKSAKKDRKEIDRQINDWRLNKPPTQSELAGDIKKVNEAISKQTEMVSGLPETLNKLEEQIKAHLSLIEEYRKENIRWRKNFRKRTKNQKSKQRKLSEWI